MMQQVLSFDAPWSPQVRWSTQVTSLLLLVIAAVGWGQAGMAHWQWQLWIIGLPLLLVALAALFAVRGYRLVDGELQVLLPGRIRRYPLAGLEQVAPLTSLDLGRRVFGLSGWFGYNGVFELPNGQRARVLATDESRFVVLQWPGQRLVVSPRQTDAFIEALPCSGKGRP